ncbi:TIGR02587 family membrane protein [Blastococcus sp. VKM Ac-2987]|uniref:TIGR02587 family membrane protein n=1 Tax=Blastococcus sp. VKM Ac-2987 TaxID=3004141 RepID=UPI0022AB6E13|nr:TIGR02587 family membrane protein [Blastococcus sp. VKM Ac-2987]MCZ2857312.1 TIGR02587 family membrane protein [Blastococcus sp. VKM Ac-2987]
MPQQTDVRQLVMGFGRGIGGALLFAMPLLMTMEVWRLAHAVDRHRLAALVLGTVLLVVGLARNLGSTGAGWRASLVDAGVAFLAAAFATASILTALDVLDWLQDWRDAVSVLLLALLPAAVGASYARAQLGESSVAPQGSGYRHELFLMVAGAVVFASNLAPTEEIVLLAAKMTPWHTLVVVAVSLTLMHAFVYLVGFGGQEEHDGPVQAFMAYTVVGFVLALCIAAYLLWTLGRFADTGLLMVITESVVLALPAGLGAAAARLIL